MCYNEKWTNIPFCGRPNASFDVDSIPMQYTFFFFFGAHARVTFAERENSVENAFGQEHHFLNHKENQAKKVEIKHSCKSEY